MALDFTHCFRKTGSNSQWVDVIFLREDGGSNLHAVLVEWLFANLANLLRKKNTCRDMVKSIVTKYGSDRSFAASDVVQFQHAFAFRSYFR